MAIDTLQPDAAAARTHNSHNVAVVRASLAQFGQRKPIVVQRRGRVVRAGNAVLEAARQLGWSQLAAVVVDEGDVPAVAYAIADNRSAELGRWDEAALGKLLGVLEDAPDFDALVTGFTAGEIARLRGLAPGLTDPDALPTDVAPRVRAGEIWQLGEHRLLCGDSTDAAAVAGLLAGERPFLMVTDPPYGVQYDPAWRVDAGVTSGGAAVGRVANDDRADWREAYALFPGDVAYVWHAALFAADVVAGLEASRFALRAQLVWVKQRPVLSRGAYHWQHEAACFAVRDGSDDRWRYEPGHEAAAYAVREGASAEWEGGRRQSTVWSIEHLKNETGHGTQKPVECMARPMRNHGAPGDVVYDPFCGSGTSLIAAEGTRRRCLAVELTPAYCDMAIARWEAFTGAQGYRIE